MNFTPLEIKPYAPLSYLNKAKSLKSGNPTERSSSLMGKENVELYVEIGSDTLLLCIGESWTWGESLLMGNYPDGTPRHLASGLPGASDPTIRVEDTWPGKMARMMQADLYVHSVPGNSNVCHTAALERILKEIPRGKYKQIKYVICLTDPARDFNGDFLPEDPRYPLFVDKYQQVDVGEKISMDEWFVRYDEANFIKIEQILQDNSDLPLEGCIWKNFNNFICPRRDFQFKVIELPYIRWAAKMCGLEDMELPRIQAAAWWINHGNYKILKELPSTEYINAELTKIENQYRFIVAVPTMISELNRTHPNYIGHWAWGYYLCDKMNWINV